MDFEVKSRQGDYHVRFLDSVQDTVARINAMPKAVVLIDMNVEGLYRPDIKHPMMLVVPTEANKTWERVGAILGSLKDIGCDRETTIVAVGGGIVQDIAATAAHLYFRGIPWVFVPTTLLAQADSCIGGKTGINLGKHKNQVGCFHPPKEVLICPAFIDTLSVEETKSGIGEILKLALIGGGWDIGHSVKSIIHSALSIKKRIIEADEFETGNRIILNYGHTFGHALESVTNNAVPHGVAVAWGMDLVNFIAWKRGWMREDLYRTVEDLIHSRVAIPMGKVTAKELIEAVKRDKKAYGDDLNLIVMREAGKMSVEKVKIDMDLEALVYEYLEEHRVF